MPPKKKPDNKKEPEEELPGYNVNIMTLDQLKQYAKLLQGEIEDMRSHCNFYQKMEDELVELLRITEDNLRQTEDSIVSKDVELERLKLKFLKHLREKRQWPEYMEQASSTKKEKLSSDTCSLLEKEQDRHLKERERLKMILYEKDRQLEALRVKIEMARRETKERNESSLAEMDKQQEQLLEEAIKRFQNVANETQDDFKQALEIMRLEAQEDKIQGERTFNATCEAYKQKLHDYYKEVTKQDLETIKKLKHEIKEVEQGINNSKLQLQHAVEENKRLKKMTESKVKKSAKSNATIIKYDANPLKMMAALKVHKRTQTLVLENRNLEEQIKDVMEKTQNLRRKFTLTLRKVQDSAEMKTAFLEKKLTFILDEKQNQSVSGETKIESETETESETSGYTVTETEETDISEN